MKRLVILVLSLALASCGAPPLPKIQTQTVFVPVQQPCKTSDKLGPDPAYVDTADSLAKVPHPDAIARLEKNPADNQALMDEMDNLGFKLKLLLEARAQRIQRDKEKSAALAGCEGDSH